MKENDSIIVKTSVIEIMKPQLASLAKEIPSGNGYLHELKYDGYRIMAYVQNREVKIITRGGFNWTSKFPSLCKALKKLKVNNAIFDGEIIVFKI